MEIAIDVTLVEETETEMTNKKTKRYEDMVSEREI